MPLKNKLATLANGASNFFQKLQNSYEKTRVGWESGYQLVMQIAPGGSAQQSFYVSGQGDFIWEYLTGKIFAYDPNTGVVDTTVTTGVTFQINESGNNRDVFMTGVINAECLLTPGYGATIYEKHNMRDYTLKATSTVRITAYNTNSTKSQQLELFFAGHQANGSVAK
jgi:hypothetical protein